jgi:hypothetical protein
VLGRGVTLAQQAHLESVLTVPDGSRTSRLDQRRTGPVTVSGPALVQALLRLQVVRDVGIVLPTAARIPPRRLASLARVAGTAKVTAINRRPAMRRLATLAAFVHGLEATAHDDALEGLERLVRDLFGQAVTADPKARLRTLNDLDQAATTLAGACQMLRDSALPDAQRRTHVFAKIPRDLLEQAREDVRSLVRPLDDVSCQEWPGRYRPIRRFLPTLLNHLRVGASPAGEPVVAAFNWLRAHGTRHTPGNDAPREVISKPWQRSVLRNSDESDMRAYTFCVLDELHTALRRREVFVTPRWRDADPRAGVWTGTEWAAARPLICRTLGLSPDPQPTLAALAEDLDQTSRAVAARLPVHPAVRFEPAGDNTELILSSLDKRDEPPARLALRPAVTAVLPRVDLPEILLEVAARTGCTDAFTHVTERTARATDLPTSLCAVLLAEACHTGPEPLIRHDVPALRRDRLFWIEPHDIRDETLIAAHATLVSAPNRLPLAQAWGGGEIASADGLRFLVPIRTVHAGPHPKDCGVGRGVPWYNLMSHQFSGLNAITVPGTLRDSLVLLAVVLEHQTE